MLKESQIRNCAAELNEMFGLKPPINVNIDMGSLMPILLKAITYQKPEDVFTPVTMAVISELKVNGEKTEIEKETPDLTEDELLTQVKTVMKLRELKDVANANVEFKIIRGNLEAYKNIEELRTKMMEILFDLNPPVKTVVPDPAPEAEVAPEPAPEVKPATKAKTPKPEAPVPDAPEHTTDPFVLKINPLFEAACPVLTEEEFKNLEDLICADGVVNNPILRWGEFIVDGHNRYVIATKHGIPFKTEEKNFDSEHDVILWIKENALGQRNLTDFAKFEMMKEVEEILQKIGKEKMKVGSKGTKPAEKHNSRKELSKKSGLSETQIKKAKVVDKNVDETTKEKLRKGETSIGKEYEKVKDSKPISEFDQVELAAQELDKWVEKYIDNQYLKVPCRSIATFIDTLREITAF